MKLFAVSSFVTFFSIFFGYLQVKHRKKLNQFCFRYELYRRIRFNFFLFFCCPCFLNFLCVFLSFCVCYSFVTQIPIRCVELFAVLYISLGIVFSLVEDSFFFGSLMIFLFDPIHALRIVFSAFFHLHVG